MNKKLIGLLLSGALLLTFTGCSNNDAEVKALQEQVAKLEQQLNESEEETAKCEICNEEKPLSELDYDDKTGYTCKEQCFHAENTEETIEEVKTYKCEECNASVFESEAVIISAHNGTHYSCKEHVDLVKLYNEYCGCRSCGISIMFPEENYDLGGTPLCKDCHDRIKAEAPYGYCINPDCGMPLESTGYCDDCGDAYARVNCESCGKEFYGYELDFGMCMDCQVAELAEARRCPVPGCGGDADYCDCPSDLQEKYR